MANLSAHLELIPVFLEADSKKELMLKMLLTNKLNAKSYNYMSPLKDDNKWCVWFYANLKSYKSVEDLNDTEKELLGGLEL